MKGGERGGGEGGGEGDENAPDSNKNWWLRASVALGLHTFFNLLSTYTQSGSLRARCQGGYKEMGSVGGGWVRGRGSGGDGAKRGEGWGMGGGRKEKSGEEGGVVFPHLTTSVSRAGRLFHLHD